MTLLLSGGNNGVSLSFVGKSVTARRTSTPIRKSPEAASSAQTAQTRRPTTAASSAGPARKRARTSRSTGQSRSLTSDAEYPMENIFHFLESYDHFLSTPAATDTEDYPEEGAELPPGCLGFAPLTPNCDGSKDTHGEKVMRQKQLFAAVSTWANYRRPTILVQW